MRRFIRNNGLSITLFFFFFLTFIFGQSIAGKHDHDNELKAHGKPPLNYAEYITSDHFLEATAENWESEFLQLFSYVILTRFLYQKGSVESRDPDAPSEESNVGAGPVPWAVRKGGFILKLYEHSLSLTFLLLFILSVVVHVAAGAGEYNQEQRNHGQEEVSAWGYLLTSSFWFQSLQNWQSEFLALFAMVVLSIWLREKESPESKPVKAPHRQTGK